MRQTAQDRNKSPVLEAFDTPFTRRDYAAAKRYWCPDYIQHSAHIAPGRDGLFNLVKSFPPTLRYERRLVPKYGRAQSGDRSQALATLPCQR